MQECRKRQGNGLDHGRKGVEKTDEEHVDASHAIGGAGSRADSAHGEGHGELGTLVRGGGVDATRTTAVCDRAKMNRSAKES
jgi:hypothetical protein